MTITDIRVRTVAIPLNAQLRHNTGVHPGYFLRTVLEIFTDEGIVGLGEVGGGDQRGALMKLIPRRVYEQARDQIGQVDILVLNASVQIRERWATITPEQFDRQVNVNFRASLTLMQLAIPSMCQRGWGRVLAIGSVQQTKPSLDMPVYAATKCAQLSLVRTIAQEVAASGVTVNNLAPGVIATERNADVLADPRTASHLRRRVPVGFVGGPDDCVAAALLLCSNEGRYITGADFVVDGGWTL